MDTPVILRMKELKKIYLDEKLKAEIRLRWMLFFDGLYHLLLEFIAIKNCAFRAYILFGDLFCRVDIHAVIAKSPTLLSSANLIT